MLELQLNGKVLALICLIPSTLKEKQMNQINVPLWNDAFANAHQMKPKWTPFLRKTSFSKLKSMRK